MEIQNPLALACPTLSNPFKSSSVPITLLVPLLTNVEEISRSIRAKSNRAIVMIYVSAFHTESIELSHPLRA